MSLARYTVTPGGRIDTREELLAALDVAAELEHTLLVQYLFAATSCRKRPDGGFDERRVELVRDWEASLLGIAREEMVHLATVTKIAVAVGGAPHLEPPAFPQPAGAQFPFDLSLNRLTLRAVDRFVRFEAPGEVVLAETFAIAPDPVEFEFIGELYRQIITAIRLLAATRGEAWLLVGPQEVRAEESWGLHHVVRGIDGAQSAITALDEIITEGEGGQRDAATSHWQRFQRVREGLAEELEGDPAFTPAHPVVDNPSTRPRPGTTLLEGTAREVAELFNHLYTTVLMLLGQFYTPAGETTRQRSEVQATVRRSMSAILRPIMEVLTDILVGDGSPRRCAGAPFEVDGRIQLAMSAVARWAVLDERLERAADEAARLAGGSGIERLRFIAENIALMRDGVRRIGAGEGVGLAGPRV